MNPPSFHPFLHRIVSIRTTHNLVEGKTDGSAHGPVHLNVDLSLGGGDGAGLRRGEGGLGCLVVAGNGGGVNVIELHGLRAGDVLFWFRRDGRESTRLVSSSCRSDRWMINVFQ